MLIRYKINENVYVVSGSNFTPTDFNHEGDYTFCFSGHTWGWATWKRAWSKFTLDCDFIISKEELRERYSAERIVDANYRWFNKHANMPTGTSTWDVCWAFIRTKDKGLSIVPRVNLVSNIGEYGLHFNGKTEVHGLEYDDNFVAVNHPAEITIDKEYDKYHFYKYIYKPLWKKVLRKLRKIFKL